MIVLKAESFPYFLVEDEIFLLQEWLTKPCSKSALTNEIKQIFNYRQSCIHHVIETTFSILVSRRHILRQPIEASPEKVEKYTLAAIALHNYLHQTETQLPIPHLVSLIQKICLAKSRKGHGEGFSNMKELKV